MKRFTSPFRSQLVLLGSSALSLALLVAVVVAASPDFIFRLPF